ncbi:hypothetical protein CBR_g17795 [Chara braunii]|uniref:Expansin n=1 Tax=Chara braunii TaxID=69332 RepID=A0A388KVI7_CHABU|nr:hypothetical protein CBR_g17795 [Chara braunii]|eukprot:GBG74084.1 hypothetical protein CBR_g17795 [Chara braunii]
MACRAGGALVGAMLVLISLSSVVEAQFGGFCDPFQAPTGGWTGGTATFYSGGRGGACGFGGLGYAIYGERYAAASMKIWQNGAACGMCVEIKCMGPSGCYAGKIVKVTITDFCPNTHPNLAHCGPEKNHIDMGQNSFPVIANPRVGVINIQYRVVPCNAYGNFQVQINGNQYGWLSLLIAQIPGSGRVVGCEVQGAGMNYWEGLRRVWGSNWMRTGTPLKTPIHVRLSLLGQICKVTSRNCIPNGFYFGQAVKCNLR